MTLFQKAERKKAKLRLSIDGPSGSGKTHSALLVAGGIVPEGKIYLIDTERDSATLETGKEGIPEFFHAPLTQPFTPAKYRQYIENAVSEGAELIIIDSLSHAWSGTGGVLDMHDTAQKAQKNNNSWAAWREVTPEHNALVDALLQAPCHIICTMRTKTAWEVVDDGDKKKPVKIGLKPEQREGMEYEFTLVLDLSVDGHVATASKDRTSLFDGKYFVPNYETGQELAEWLNDGRDPAEISSQRLEQLKNSVDEINSVPHLENWWKKHYTEINRLLPADKDILTWYCADRKKSIQGE